MTTIRVTVEGHPAGIDLTLTTDFPDMETLRGDILRPTPQDIHRAITSMGDQVESVIRTWTTEKSR